jgi:hypothetical protein
MSDPVSQLMPHATAQYRPITRTSEIICVEKPERDMAMSSQVEAPLILALVAVEINPKFGRPFMQLFGFKAHRGP